MLKGLKMDNITCIEILEALFDYIERENPTWGPGLINGLEAAHDLLSVATSADEVDEILREW